MKNLTKTEIVDNYIERKIESFESCMSRNENKLTYFVAGATAFWCGVAMLVLILAQK